MLAGPQGLRLHDLALELLAVQLKPVREREQLGDGLLGGKTFVQRTGLDVVWRDYAGGRRQYRVVQKEDDVNYLFASDGAYSVRLEMAVFLFGTSRHLRSGST